MHEFLCPHKMTPCHASSVWTFNNKNQSANQSNTCNPFFQTSNVQTNGRHLTVCFQADDAIYYTLYVSWCCTQRGLIQSGISRVLSEGTNNSILFVRQWGNNCPHACWLENRGILSSRKIFNVRLKSRRKKKNNEGWGADSAQCRQSAISCRIRSSTAVFPIPRGILIRQ